jgi:hypothetical protein
MKKLSLFIVPFMLMASSSFGQEVETEKTYEISRKSKRGYLAGVDFDDAAKTYQLTYITKQTERKLKYEFYKFDNDFNFLSDGEGEEKFELMKSKFKWFKFRELLYTVEGVTVENNFTGTLVMKRKRTEYKYDFWISGYHKVVTLLEKLKPKTDDGRKMSLITYAEDDKTGEILVLAGIKLKLGKNMAEKNPRPYDLHFMRFNKDLDILAETIIPFEEGNAKIGAKVIYELNEEDPENPGIESLALVFATGADKNTKPTCTYLRLGADTKIQHRETFTSSSSYWNLDEMIYDSEKKDMYLFGPTVNDAGKFAAGKYKAIQLVKINADGKKEYQTETGLEEFNAKLKTPPTQKKAPEYEGKKFEFSTYKVASNGDLFVSGQNFKIDASGNDKGGKNFKDIMGFHFDGKGVLRSQYGVDTKENGKEANDFGTPQEFIEGREGNMFWLLREIKDYNATHGKLLTYPRLAKISPQGTVSDFLTMGKSEGYFLDPKYPYLETDKGNRLVFFGANKAGKSLWFCKVKLN